MKGKHVHIFKDQNTHSPEEPKMLGAAEFQQAIDAVFETLVPSSSSGDYAVALTMEADVAGRLTASLAEDLDKSAAGRLGTVAQMLE